MKQTEKKSRRSHARSGLSRKAEEPQIVVRRAKSGDLPSVVRMSRGVREIENYPGQKMKQDDFVGFVEGYGGLMLVATVKEKVVGYVTVYESENYFYLPYAVTAKAWRRRGVAGALLDEVERLAKKEKVEYIFMSAYLYNSAVHSFLKGRGYIASKKLIQYSRKIGSRGGK